MNSKPTIVAVEFIHRGKWLIDGWYERQSDAEEHLMNLRREFTNKCRIARYTRTIRRDSKGTPP